MNRRNVLESAVAATAGLLATNTVAAVAPGAREPFIVTGDGARLFYRDWGAGPPVLFLAPWGLHSDWWEYQMANLADQGLRCVSYDRRGHGRSTETIDGYDFDTLAADLN